MENKNSNFHKTYKQKPPQKTTAFNKNPRQLVFDALNRVLYEGAYSNIAIDMAIRENQLDKAQTSFAVALFYGVLENSIKLDYAISKYLSKKISTLDKEVLIILRIGFYQLVSLDSVPDNAAVDESVKLCMYARKVSAKGFVNAIMRSFLRDDKKINLPDEKKDAFLYYSIKYSCPQWLIKMWASQYNMETAILLCEASLNRPPLTIRTNTLKTTSEKLIGYLENRGVKAVCHDYLEDCLVIENSGSIDRLPQYRQGLFYVQDVASQLCTKVVDAKPDQTVIDMCSAPGSKAFTIAQDMQNQGELLAFDLFEHKLKIINDQAKKLGITIIKSALQDGSVFNADIPKADKVLCDVPCSGLGIIRRKPEIKYKNFEDLKGLPDIQYKILSNAANYVKDGGCLIYSTCTINKNENEAVVNKFLSENNLFKPLQLSNFLDKIEVVNDFFVTLFPHINHCDGFFIAAFVKSN